MPMTLLQADGFYFGFIEYDSQLSMQPTTVLKLRSSPNYLQKKALQMKSTTIKPLCTIKRK
jgi:hypothetical protein